MPTVPPALASDFPWWVGLPVGFLLVGVSVSILVRQIRVAIPPPRRLFPRVLYFLSPSLLGALFAAMLPSLFLGAPPVACLLCGVIAPYIRKPVYRAFYRYWERRLELNLPNMPKLLVEPPKPLPTPTRKGAKNERRRPLA